MTGNEITKEARKYLTELSKEFANKPFLKLTGEYKMIKGEELSKHNKKQKRRQGKGFNKKNMYAMPIAEVIKRTENEIYNDLVYRYKTKGVELVVSYINELKEAQRVYANNYSN